MDKRRFGGLIERWEDCERLFENASVERAVGEASVWYLWSRSAARILIVLREPAERAFSQYLHGVGIGAITWSFRERLRRNLDDRSGKICVHYPFLEFGHYSEQVDRYLRTFPRVFVGLYEDHCRDAAGFFSGISEFLDVDPGLATQSNGRELEAQVPRMLMIGLMLRWGVWGRVANLTPKFPRPVFRRALTRARPVMQPEDRQFLRDHYRVDVHKLAERLGRDLSAWTSD